MPYQPYQAPTTGPQFGYSNESDPRKLAANQRSVVQSTGDNLMSADQQLANQYAGQASGVEQYLDPLESNLAAGNGGYTADEASQIEYSPQDAQNLVNSAGISAGQQTAASVDAADRAAAAAGGSPAALATYRARAAQTGAVNTANAETAAQVAAKQAQSTGAQTVGNAQIAQQNQGLGYYSGLQQEKNTNSLSEQGLQQGAYGTQTTGTSDAANIGLKASQTPTTTDKVIGAVSEAAPAVAGLADGRMGDGDAPAATTPVAISQGKLPYGNNYYDPEQNSGQGDYSGPLANDQFSILPLLSGLFGGKSGGSSSSGLGLGTALANGRMGYLADGDMGFLDPDGQDAVVGENGMEAVINNAPPAVQRGASDPVRGNTRFMDNGTSGSTPSPSSPGMPDWLARYLATVAPSNKGNSQQANPSQVWNKTTPYQQLGSAVGKVITTLKKPQSNSSSGGFGPRGFAPGSSQMPSSSPNPSTAPYKMPDGLINRTGAPIDGTPSMGAPVPADAGDVGTGSGVDPALLSGDAADVGGDAADAAGGLADVGADVGAGIGDAIGALADGQSGGGLGNYLADGDAPWASRNTTMMVDGRPRNGMRVGSAQIFTRPTAVRLNKADAVVPLSYRAKAKVRPSAALPALSRSGVGYAA